MTATYKPAILASFLLISSLGSSFVYLNWAAKGSPGIGILNGCLFIAIMVCIHAIGLLLYQQQLQATASTVRVSPVRTLPFRITGSIRNTTKVAIYQQIVLLILTALLLDGGHTYRMTFIAAIVHWICIAVIIVRRSAHPTQVDLVVIKFGFLPLILIVSRMAPWIHQILNQ